MRAVSSSAGQRLFVFLVGTGFWAIPLERVEEVVLMATLSRPPGLPSILEGFLNLRGSAVAALRMDRLLLIEEWRRVEELQAMVQESLDELEA